MFTPLPEMYIGDGLISSTDTYSTPPGVLDFQNSMPVFIRENEVVIKRKKKIVLCDNFFHLFVSEFYNSVFGSLDVHPEIEEKASKLIDVEIGVDDGNSYSSSQNPYLEEQDSQILTFYSDALAKIIDGLIDAGFEIYYYIDSTIVKFEQKYLSIDDPNSFLYSTEYTSNSEIYKIFAKQGTPADQIYILNVPKATQIIAGLDKPAILDAMLAAIDILYKRECLPLNYYTEVIPTTEKSIDDVVKFLKQNRIEKKSRTIATDYNENRGDILTKLEEGTFVHHDKVTELRFYEPLDFKDIYYLCKHLPNLEDIMISGESYIDYSEGGEQINCKLKLLQIYLVDMDLNFQPPTYLEDCFESIYPLVKNLPSLEIVVDRFKVYSANTLRKTPGANYSVIIDDDNINLPEMAEHLNNDLQVHTITLTNVISRDLFKLFSALSLDFKHNIKRIFIQEGIEFYDGELSQIIQYFPSLVYVQLDESNLPPNECDVAEAFELVNNRNIRFVVESNPQVRELSNVAENDVGNNNVSNQSAEGSEQSHEMTFRLNIEDTIPVLHNKKIFYAKDIDNEPTSSSYRLEIFSHKLQSDAVFDANNPVIQLNKLGAIVEEYELPPPCGLSLTMDYRSALTRNQYFGTQKLELSNSWTSLASLATNETLRALSVFDAKKEPIKFKLGYCRNTNLYYISLDLDVVAAQSNKSTYVTANFILTIVKKPEFESDDQELSELIDTTRNYSMSNIKNIDMTELNGKPIQEFIAKLAANQAGACFERSLIFAQTAIDKNLLWFDQVRIVSNDVHTFCEVMDGHSWTKLELGGAPATVLTFNAEDSKIQPLPQFNANNQELEKSTLIQMPAEDIEGYALGLLEHYTLKYVTVCYIHNMDDLTHKDNNQDFKDFITKAENTAFQAVLIINLQNFNGEELVRINTILDPQPNINGMIIPKAVQIVGLHDSNSSISNGDTAFYSRFSTINLYDPSIRPYVSRIQNLPYKLCDEVPAEIIENSVIIDCYEAVFWRGRLFGAWEMQGKELVFKENELLQRLAPKRTGEGKKRMRPESKINIIINNPSPSENFKLFWARASITKKITVNGIQYAGFKSIYCAHFSNMHLSQQFVEWDASPIFADKFYHILNSSTFEDFFKAYTFADADLQINPGLISKSVGNKLQVQLTHNISWQKWARLLDECAKYNVILQVLPRIELLLPEGFKTCEIEIQITVATQHNYCITPQTANLAFDILAFNASEDEVEKLIARVDYRLENANYKFDHIESDLIKMLDNGQSIVLYGNLSTNFAEKFASMLNGARPYLLINGNIREFSGKLYCMPDMENLPNFDFAPKITIDECNFVRRIEEVTDVQPLVWLDENDISDDQMSIRANNLLQAMSANPVVYITGKTGIGKSTFINNQLKKYTNCVVFNEIDQILNWAECLDPYAYKILFFDEANMAGIDFMVFDSLFASHKHILYQGKIIPLTDKHIVVLAGNACSYAGDRKLPNLVKQHPTVEVPFAPLTRGSIENIIRSTLCEHGIDSQHRNYEKMITVFCNIYEFISNLDEEHVYITAREIKFALQLIIAQYTTSFVTIMVFVNALPEKYKSNLIDYLKLKVEDQPAVMNALLAKKQIALSQADYLVTDSRKSALLSMHAILRLRSIALSKGYGMPMAGIILEGVPSTGKSDLIRFTLNSQGYNKAETPAALFESSAEVIKHFENLATTDQQFVACYASYNLEVRKEILLSAYKKGLIVVFDEFNSAIKGLERLLNDLLMNQYQGVSAEKPGFLLIGAQNHISLAGRSNVSEALRRRLVFVDVVAYSKAELVSILQHKHSSLSTNVINKSVDNFINKPITFLYQGLKVTRTLRDLEREVTEIERNNIAQQQANTTSFELCEVEPLPYVNVDPTFDFRPGT